MKIQELQEKEMYVLVSPDGVVQLLTLAPEFSFCVALIRMLAEYKIMRPLTELFEEGCTIMPIKVTILQNGNENKPFVKSKKSAS